MSHNQSPVKIIVADSLYEILTKRRADRNARLAADGLPPTTDDFPFITKEQAEAEARAQAEAKRRATQNTAANLAPPPPARGPLCRAAKAKVAQRTAAIPGFDRHSRKCQICRSPYVDLIEQVYLQWERVDNICRYFQLADTDTLYRHARAAGLDVLRRQNSRWVVEQFIEQWRDVKISSATVIRSIRALSCLDEKGHWSDLPKTHIFVRGNDVPSDAATSSTGDPIVATVTSSTNLPEMGPSVVLMPSTEQREPQKNSSADFLATSHSPLATDTEGKS